MVLGGPALTLAIRRWRRAYYSGAMIMHQTDRERDGLQMGDRGVTRHEHLRPCDQILDVQWLPLQTDPSGIHGRGCAGHAPSAGVGGV